MYCKLKNIIRIPRISKLKEEPLVTLQWIIRNKEAFHSPFFLLSTPYTVLQIYTKVLSINDAFNYSEKNEYQLSERELTGKFKIEKKKINR